MPQSVQSLFAEVLGLPPETVDDQLSPETNSLWDSVQSINLVMALEDEYGVKFSTREIVGMTSVGAVRQVLRQKGVAEG